MSLSAKVWAPSSYVVAHAVNRATKRMKHETRSGGKKENIMPQKITAAAITQAAAPHNDKEYSPNSERGLWWVQAVGDQSVSIGVACFQTILCAGDRERRKEQ